MSLSSNSSVLVVQPVVDSDGAPGELRQVTSGRERDNLSPLVDRGLGALGRQDSRDARAATKMQLGCVGEHGRRDYSMLESNFKDAVSAFAYASRMDESMGQRIKRLRDARGWTQGQLAELTGVTVSAVSQWELDLTENVKLVPFLRLAKVLETDPHYLVFGPGRGAQELSKPVQVVPAKRRPRDPPKG